MFFFFKNTATTEIYPLPLHDALPIWLRVHVIPPLDGIYAQWDFNANRMKRFYNSSRLDGVDVDGKNDEVFGNLDDPCNSNYDANDTSELDQNYQIGRAHV